MSKKITAIGTTKKGVPKFTLSHKDKFFQQLAQWNGSIKITVELIEDDATEKQKTYFRAEVLSTFMTLAAKDGNRMTEQEAEAFLIKENAKIDAYCCEDLTKSEMSELIDTTKQFLMEFYNLELL